METKCFICGKVIIDNSNDVTLTGRNVPYKPYRVCRGKHVLTFSRSLRRRAKADKTKLPIIISMIKGGTHVS